MVLMMYVKSSDDTLLNFHFTSFLNKLIPAGAASNKIKKVEACPSFIVVSQ